MSVTRARDEPAKASRRHQLLAAAATRLDAAGYAATTMSEIAAEAGLAKGTTYLYFRSKEALFLELLLEDLAEWVRAVRAAIPGRSEGRRTLDAAIDALVATMAERPRLVGLLALRYPSLEEGAGPLAAAESRRAIRDHLAPLADHLAAETQVHDLAGATTLLDRFLVLVAGLADRVVRPEPDPGRPAPGVVAEREGRGFSAELRAMFRLLAETDAR